MFLFHPKHLCHVKKKTKTIENFFCWVSGGYYNIRFFSPPPPLFNQVGQLRTSSHLQLRPGQEKRATEKRARRYITIWG
jgi:hypothetical protein